MRPTSSARCSRAGCSCLETAPRNDEVALARIAPAPAAGDRGPLPLAGPSDRRVRALGDLAHAAGEEHRRRDGGAGGAGIVAGGARFPTLRFNRTSAGAHVSTLFLAVVALGVPTMLATAGQVPHRAHLLSEEISAVLIAMYALSLFFQLRTHASLLESPDDARPPLRATPAEAAAAGRAQPVREHRPVWIPAGALMLSAGATAVASELLVGALEGTLQAVHLPEAFVGVVIVAVVGNAAEHSTAVLFGKRGDMDVALGIAWESSKQIALFVAPVLVFVGVLLGAPMDLAFRPMETVAVGVAVLSTALIGLDGETHWLEGAFLLAVYAVLALGFWFVG